MSSQRNSRRAASNISTRYSFSTQYFQPRVLIAVLVVTLLIAALGAFIYFADQVQQVGIVTDTQESSTNVESVPADVVMPLNPTPVGNTPTPLPTLTQFQSDQLIAELEKLGGDVPQEVFEEIGKQRN